MNSKPNKPSPTLKELAAGIIPAVDDLLSRIEMANLQIDDLTAQGIAHGSISYKAERYAYLIHPTQNGERQREYIGSDPATIADAENRLERGRRVDILRSKLVSLEYSVSAATAALHQFYMVSGSDARSLAGRAAYDA